MLNNDYYSSRIKGNVVSLRFEDFLQSAENPFPKTRIYDFMTVGPFAAKTDGAFETEYLYQRHKVLAIDYLLSSGGEKNAAPYLGLKIKNDYFGEEYLRWTCGVNKDEAYYKAIFSTEQRNCVFYSALYVDCEKAYDAIICHETSGCQLFLNGEMVDNQPYGRVKGIRTTGRQVAVTFNKGRNLVMFKLRTGYICDSFDLGIAYCTIYPVAVRSGNIGISYPERTTAYFGTAQVPRQIFPAFAGAFSDTQGGTVSYYAKGFSQSIDVPSLKPGECVPVRLSVPTAEEEETTEVSLSVREQGAQERVRSIFVQTLPYCGYEGVELYSSDFHFDTTYHQEQRTYAMGAIYLTKCMVEELKRNPNFKATLSEIDYLHPYYSIYPEDRETIKKAFEQGRAEADCFYNQPNDLTSSGEGFARNLIYGQLYHRDVLGRITHIYSPGDVFGHFNQLSQVCAKGGTTAARWGKTVWGLDSVLHHISPDGTDIIHNKGVDMKSAMRLGLKHCYESSGLLPNVAAYPQDGNTDWQKETITKAASSVFSELDFGIAQDDREQKEQKGISNMEVSSRDLTQHHSGVLLTRTDFKQANRLCENLLITAEKLSTIAAMYAAQYPEKALDKAWRQLLCAQHHDSITGTNNEISFVDLMIEYREALELAADIVNRAAVFLASGAKIKAGEMPYFIFNPHTWARCEPCEILLPEYACKGHSLYDEKGREYRLQAVDSDSKKGVFIPKVPALGYAVYILKKSDSVAEVSFGSDNTIENRFYRVRVDEKLGGGIVSIYDKINKREVLRTDTGGPANRVAVLREVADRMEAQHELYTTGQKLFSSDYKAKVVSEKCELYEKLTIYVKLDIIANVKQEIALYKGIDRIDLKTSVEDYLGRDDLFTLTFPVDIKGGKTVYDDRYAPHVCSKSKNKLSFQTHQHASFSHSRIVPANQWIDLGPTVTVAFMKNGKPLGDINIGMTSIIRHDESKELKLISNKLLTALTKKAIPVTQFPDTEQQGHTKVIHFNEDLTNTDTRFVLCVEGENNEYENKILSALKPSLKKRYENNVGKKGISILFLRDSDNAFGKPIDVLLVKAKNIDKLEAFINDVSRQLEAGRWLILDDVICATQAGFTDDYGVAVINQGTISCSVEGENMLNMMLFHTADFYGNIGNTTGGEQLIPEEKTHSFLYSIYPHKGSYREAKLYRKAFEVNDPLFSICNVSPAKNQPLPLSKSFIKCNEDFIITTIKAGGYPMAAMKGRFGSIEERGLIIRGFEPNGTNGTAVIKFDFDIDSAESVNLLEEENRAVKHGKNSLRYIVGSHSIESFRFGIKRASEQIGASKLGIEKEPVEPVYVRSWEHDLGSMPLGYFSVVGVIGKRVEKIDDLHYRFNVSIVNNKADAGASGKMTLLLSKGFSSDKIEFEYNLAPNDYRIYPIVITKPSVEANGIIRLHYQDDGQSFEDIFEFGYFNPEIDLSIIGNRIKAVVSNFTGEDINGELSLATPFETWKTGGFNKAAFGNISPRTLKVDIKNGEQREYIFNVEFDKSDILLSYWAVAKLMINGRIHFAYACKRGEPHNLSSSFFYKHVRQDSGSMKKLLEMN